MQSEAGQRQEALATATQAAEHYRQLAQANPAAFLPDLAMSLNNLANRQSEAGQRQEALAVFEDAARNLRAGPAAELTVRWAFWQSAHDAPDGAHSDLLRAARLADEEQEPAAARRARHAVRDAAGALLLPGESATVDDVRAQLPGWATHPIPDAAVELANRWSQATSWLDQEEFLRREATALGQPAETQTLAVLRALYPDRVPLADLDEILREIEEHGLDTTLAGYRDAWDFQELLQGWIDTPTWAASRRYLADHPELATDPRTADALGSAPDDPTAVQHLAILRLTATLPVDDVYDAVDDPSIARDEAMAAVAAGDAITIENLWLAAPALGRLPFTGPFVAAAHRILTGDEDDEDDDVQMLVEAAAAAGDPVQRAAAAARLRRLARTRPEHADTVGRLLPILEAEPETEPTEAAYGTEQPA
jgi:hypothetical protein